VKNNFFFKTQKNLDNNVSIDIDQRWPDFFSHGPFSIIFYVLGAASSFQGVEVAKNFENFSADL
jgi:hypothetical protein